MNKVVFVQEMLSQGAVPIHSSYDMGNTAEVGIHLLNRIPEYLYGLSVELAKQPFSNVCLLLTEGKRPPTEVQLAQPGARP
jgi:hypothetical protein